MEACLGPRLCSNTYVNNVLSSAPCWRYDVLTWPAEQAGPLACFLGKCPGQPPCSLQPSPFFFVFFECAVVGIEQFASTCNAIVRLGLCEKNITQYHKKAYHLQASFANICDALLVHDVGLYCTCPRDAIARILVVNNRFSYFDAQGRSLNRLTERQGFRHDLWLEPLECLWSRQLEPWLTSRLKLLPRPTGDKQRTRGL